MAPRKRGIPRRGSNFGSRGRQGGRGSPEPRRISPLAMAAPSSPTSDESGPSLNSSLHSARFKFKSRLNKPLISALVTVIFLEEEDDPASSAAASTDQSPSKSANSSQSRLVEDHLEVSAEVQEEEGHEEDNLQQSSPQEPIIDSHPVKEYANILHLRTPPDGSLLEVKDGVMVTWERAPDKVEEHDTEDSK